jgi:hypothetical protein
MQNDPIDPKSMTLSPAEPYDFMKSAEVAFTSEGFDWPLVFDRLWNHGYVFKGPGYLVAGIEDPERLDAWLIWWAEMHPTGDPAVLMATVFKLMPYTKPFFGFVRRMKGETDVKYYSTERFMRSIPVSPTNDAPTHG